MWALAYKLATNTLGWFAKKADARIQELDIRADVSKTAIEADVQFARIRKDILKMQFGWGPTRWIVPCIAYPVILWFGLVVLDSINILEGLGLVTEEGWKVDALPAPLTDWTGEIILSFFLVSGAQAIVGSLMNPAKGLIGRVADKIFGSTK
jgi:hypothetical protein